MLCCCGLYVQANGLHRSTWWMPTSACIPPSLEIPKVRFPLDIWSCCLHRGSSIPTKGGGYLGGYIHWRLACGSPHLQGQGFSHECSLTMSQKSGFSDKCGKDQNDAHSGHYFHKSHIGLTPGKDILATRNGGDYADQCSTVSRMAKWIDR